MRPSSRNTTFVSIFPVCPRTCSTTTPPWPGPWPAGRSCWPTVLPSTARATACPGVPASRWPPWPPPRRRKQLQAAGCSRPIRRCAASRCSAGPRRLRVSSTSPRTMTACSAACRWSSPTGGNSTRTWPCRPCSRQAVPPRCGCAPVAGDISRASTWTAGLSRSTIGASCSSACTRTARRSNGSAPTRCSTASSRRSESPAASSWSAPPPWAWRPIAPARSAAWCRASPCRPR